MKKSVLALSLALGFSLGLGAVARADQTAPASAAPPQTAQAPSQATENAALQDYKANINPNWNVPTTGIYDEEDRYTGPTGTPLPGWGAINGEGAGDNGG
jgi:hypothetical protein